MQVILEKDVKTLGYRGDVVAVRPGYFRNFLYPRGLASVATMSAKKLAEARKEKAVMVKEKVVSEAKSVIEKISGLKVVVKESANEKGHLYAAVSESEVVSAVASLAKVQIDPSFLKMDHIKELGEYKIAVQIGGEKGELNLVVEAL